MSSSRSETSSGDSIRIELLPLGEILSAPHGTSLHDVLFAKGVEFPCGGQGRCRGCRIRVIEGELPLTDAEENLLSREELEAGWRLACRGIVREDLKLDLAQWETPILADDSEFSFSPRDGLGVAVDLGTTTIAAQLIDMRSGKVLGVRTALNSQARHGADIMSRIEHATARNGQEQLKRMIREQVGDLISKLHTVPDESHPPLTEVVLVGNTAMHHFFCDID
ncbi:MAG: 2Fe-2S iron-sulfur cluster-binding protein, partial [Roseibacillus sp.]|nr:2Fe-2S iron-sulfur cluster-binding protein [Roseibacillus sp.]